MFKILYLIFKPLAKHVFKELFDSEMKKNINIDKDLIDDTLINTIDNTALFYTILKYDVSKNSNFFGYIKKMLKFNAKSELRTEKTQLKTQQNNFTLKDLSDENILKNSQIANLDSENSTLNIQTIIQNLPDKERKAIKKAYYNNENLNDTERKAKNRGFKKIRLNHPELKSYL